MHIFISIAALIRQIGGTASEEEDRPPPAPLPQIYVIDGYITTLE